MIISSAEAFFIVLIALITAVSAYLGWVYLLPRLPVRIPPVLFCITVGCGIRLICKPLLESPSADAYLAADATPKHLHLYGEGVVRTLSSPFISLCLAGVGILIGSHFDLPFLKQHTRALVSLSLCSVLGAYSTTFAVATACWPGVGLMHFVHLVAATAMERSSGEALATISDMRSLLSPHSSVVFFAKSTIFVGAAMDITSVVVFVMSLAVVQAGTGFWHIVEIFLGTVGLALTALGVVKLHLLFSAAQQSSSSSSSSSVANTAAKSSDPHNLQLSVTVAKAQQLQHQQQQQSGYWNWIASPVYHNERQALLILVTLVIGNHVFPGAELLLAAVAVGMRLSYVSSSSSHVSHIAAADATALASSVGGISPPPNRHDSSSDFDVSSELNSPSKSPAPVAPHGLPHQSVIAVIESNSVLMYSVLFAIIGLRLDAQQLLATLFDAPKISLLLFAGRLLGLVAGGVLGTLLGGGGGGAQGSSNKTHMKWRGISLVTRIAVSIILLQKMEDALPDAKPMVHAAIGAVLLDMCFGPALLQFALKRVEASAVEGGE